MFFKQFLIEKFAPTSQIFGGTYHHPIEQTNFPDITSYDHETDPTSLLQSAREHAKKLGVSGSTILSHYKEDSGIFNNYLRGYPHAWTPSQSDIKNLDFATSHRITKPLIGYRAYQDPRFFDYKLKRGQIIHDKGYIGTSLNPFVAMKKSNVLDYEHKIPHIVQIHMPVNTKGFYIEPYNNQYNESEFLLHRGTKLRVIGHSIKKNNTSYSRYYPHIHVVHMTIHSQENHHPDNIQRTDSIKERKE